MSPKIIRPDAYTGDAYDSLAARSLTPGMPEQEIGLIVLRPLRPGQHEEDCHPLHPGTRRVQRRALLWPKPDR